VIISTEYPGCFGERFTLEPHQVENNKTYIQLYKFIIAITRDDRVYPRRTFLKVLHNKAGGDSDMHLGKTIGLSSLATIAFLGAAYAAVLNIPQQHEELNRYPNAKTEFTCWNRLFGIDGQPFNIWATVEKDDLKVGWLGNAVPGIRAKVDSEQGIGIARQFCNTGSGTLPDGKVSTAAPFLKP
jgi:hypothetical protein